MKPVRHLLSEKANQILDLAGYKGKRIAFHSSAKGWVIGDSQKFVALGLTVEEALENGILIENPYNKLYNLCEKNSIIHIDWIRDVLSPDDFIRFGYWMTGQTSTMQGIYASDVKNFLEKLATDTLDELPHGF